MSYTMEVVLLGTCVMQREFAVESTFIVYNKSTSIVTPTPSIWFADRGKCLFLVLNMLTFDCLQAT